MPGQLLPPVWAMSKLRLCCSHYGHRRVKPPASIGSCLAARNLAKTRQITVADATFSLSYWCCSSFSFRLRDGKLAIGLIGGRLFLYLGPSRVGIRGLLEAEGSNSGLVTQQFPQLGDVVCYAR